MEAKTNCRECGIKPIHARGMCSTYYARIRRRESDRVKKYRYVAHRKCIEKNKIAWRKWFKTQYKNPSCEICNKILRWEGSKSEVVHWDHCNGRIEGMRHPADFWHNKACTSENRKKWKSFKFGILCDACNLNIPTDTAYRYKMATYILEKTLVLSKRRLNEDFKESHNQISL